MTEEIRAACTAEIPGDTHRDLEVASRWSGVARKNALLPVWIAAYQYAGKPYRFLVNGVTGRVSGKAPISWAKVAAVVLAALALLTLLAQLR